MTTLVAVVAALALYRCTLLVVADEITAPVRDRLVHRWTRVEHRLMAHTDTRNGGWKSWACSCGERWEPLSSDALSGQYHWQRHVELAPRTRESRAATLITCPWCSSVWLAFPVVASAIWWGNGRGWLLVAGSLAASAVTGFLASYASPG